MGKLNVSNRTLFISDNLPILEGMNSETVDLILIDPPFNKKRQFQGIGKASKAKFNDTWTWRENVHPEWMPKMREHNRAIVEVIESAYHAHDPGMAAYIAWMSIRTLELHRILKPTGSMYLHCDPTASHYLKAMMDAIFGVGNYQNEIVWRRAFAHNDPKRFGRITDNILFYTRSSDFTWNVQHTDYSDEYINKFFRLDDERGKYQAITLTGPGVSSGDSGGRWRGYSPTDSGRTWSVPRRIVERILGPEGHLLSITQRLDSLDAHGYIYWPPKGRVPRVKQYLHEMPGVPVQNLWADISYLTAHHKERTGWPTQKPLALYSRIIKASTNEGDLVLDAFAGCATTCVAAEQFGRQWVGIDIDDEAEKVTLDRLQRETRSFGEVDAPTVDRPQLYVRREPPIRTPDAPAPPTFKTPKRRKASIPMPPLSEARKMLATRDGTYCQGCGFEPPKGLLDFLEVDHKLPKADGGTNAYDNLCLLCAPCNRRKGHILTLSGLRRLNRKEERMLGNHW